MKADQTRAGHGRAGRGSLSSIEASSNAFLTIIVKVLLLLYVCGTENDRDNEDDHDDDDDDEMLSLDVDTGLSSDNCGSRMRK